MRAVRDEAMAVIENAAIRRNALNAIDADQAGPWLSELAPALSGRIATMRRMQARLFEQLVDDACDPAELPEAVRRLLSLGSGERRNAAIWAGLAYHIASFGPAMTRGTIERLSAVFGKMGVAFALANSHIAATAPSQLPEDDNRFRALVEADGWAILKLWAGGHGLEPIWQAGWGRGCEGGSVSLHRPAVEAIAAALDTRLDAIDGDELASDDGRDP